MANISLFLGLLHEPILREHLQHSRSRDINYVQLTKEVPFVFLVYFPLACENVVERLLN